MHPTVRNVVVLGDDFSPEASALFARFTTPPTAARKTLIDTTILALKDAAIWDELDGLIVEAAHDAQAGRQNWKVDNYHLTEVNPLGLTFLADRGYTSNGTTGYLSSTFNPTTAVSPKFTRDNAHMGVWTGTDVIAAVNYDCGALNSRINALAAAAVHQIAANDAAANRSNAGVATSIGWTCWSRSLATEFDVVRDDGTVRNFLSNSVAPSNLPFFVCAYANTGSVAAGFSTRRQQAFHWGGHLNQTKRDAFHDILAAYMTAVGAA